MGRYLKGVTDVPRNSALLFGRAVFGSDQTNLEKVESINNLNNL